tara:strand:- start:94 stop:258 length:165 start_codon:yes stop_codon:yes gene_type:complete
MKLKDKDITPKYVNDKLESIVVALMDTIVEQEDRLKNIETQLFELKNGTKNSKG